MVLEELFGVLYDTSGQRMKDVVMNADDDIREHKDLNAK